MKQDHKRMFLAFALSAVVLFLWQIAFPGAKPETLISSSNQKVQKRVVVDDKSLNVKSTKVDPVKKVDTSKIYSLQNGNWKYDIDSLLNIKLISVEDGFFTPERVLGKSFNFSFLSNSAQFNIQQVSQNEIVAENSEQSVVFKINETGDVNYLIESKNPGELVFKIQSEEGAQTVQQKREFIFFFDDVERVSVSDDGNFDGKLGWFGVDYEYHFFSAVMNEKYPTRVTVLENGITKVVVTAPKKIEGSLRYLRKDYDNLKVLGHNLDKAVNFGMFAIIAVPIYRMLQFFYNFIPNYGIAIILITLVLRLLTYPLQHKSFKSMKKMQQIQPEIKALKEKLKDDPQRLNKETMELFKRAGANPLGGCLPLILQLPVFFAFYKVLYNSIELVEAPLFGWITDLSVKDPIYVLPILMTITMFFQTKLNPSATTDANQQKIMQFMPLIFGFIMKDLPSGLVLYILVSTFFGIVQQLMVYKFSKN